MITLIEHGWVVPVDGRDAQIEDGAVAIEGDRIVAVGPTRDVAVRVGASRTIDARGKAILPGFVNTHIHLIGGINKGLTEDESGVSGGCSRSPCRCITSTPSPPTSTGWPRCTRWKCSPREPPR